MALRRGGGAWGSGTVEVGGERRVRQGEDEKREIRGFFVFALLRHVPHDLMFFRDQNADRSHDGNTGTAGRINGSNLPAGPSRYSGWDEGGLVLQRRTDHLGSEAKYRIRG